jgi:hypothetical protein
MVFSQKASKTTLDRLIMSNIKIIELYDKNLPLTASDPKVWQLVKIRDEHKKQTALLKRLMQDLGERVASEPKPMPEKDKAQHTYIIDNHELLHHFIECEMQQIEECERALTKKQQLSERIKTTIETSILPKLKLHIDLIEQLIQLRAKKASG